MFQLLGLLVNATITAKVGVGVGAGVGTTAGIMGVLLHRVLQYHNNCLLEAYLQVLLYVMQLVHHLVLLALIHLFLISCL